MLDHNARLCLFITLFQFDAGLEKMYNDVVLRLISDLK